jgi:hypothetical protein
VRAYSAFSQEALRARDLLKDWAGEGFLTEAQYQRMGQETVCELRRTNIFLRLVLLLFTLIIVGAAVALFFVVFLSQPAMQASRMRPPNSPFPMAGSIATGSRKPSPPARLAFCARESRPLCSAVTPIR